MKDVEVEEDKENDTSDTVEKEFEVETGMKAETDHKVKEVKEVETVVFISATL